MRCARWFVTSKSVAKYMLTVCDSKSLWVELAGVKYTGAETVMFSRHGFPDGITLLTGNAQNFRSALLKAFTQTIVSVSINNALRTMCSQQQHTWPNHLQAIACLYVCHPAPVMASVHSKCRTDKRHNWPSTVRCCLQAKRFRLPNRMSK